MEVTGKSIFKFKENLRKIPTDRVNYTALAI